MHNRIASKFIIQIQNLSGSLSRRNNQIDNTYQHSNFYLQEVNKEMYDLKITIKLWKINLFDFAARGLIFTNLNF
jgi:hypothetical protein